MSHRRMSLTFDIQFTFLTVKSIFQAVGTLWKIQSRKITIALNLETKRLTLPTKGSWEAERDLTDL